MPFVGGQSQWQSKSVESTIDDTSCRNFLNDAVALLFLTSEDFSKPRFHSSENGLFPISLSRSVLWFHKSHSTLVTAVPAAPPDIAIVRVPDGVRRYRYYISRALVTGNRSHVHNGRRIPAGDIEHLITDQVCTFLTSPEHVHNALEARVPDAAEQEHLIERAVELGRTWNKLPVVEQRAILSTLLARIDVGADRINIHLDRARLAAILRVDHGKRPMTMAKTAPTKDIVVLPILARLKRTGIGKRMVIEGARAGEPDGTLIKLFVKAFALRDKLLAGDHISIDELSAREKMAGSYATRLLRLTFLAPDIVREILDGRHPPTLTANRLMADTRLPLAWTEHRSRLGVG